MSTKSYHHQHKKRLEISWEKYGKMIVDLAKKVKDEFNPGCIVGNSKGGCIIGGTLAAVLRADFYPMRISRRKNDEVIFKKPKVTTLPSKDVFNKKILLSQIFAVYLPTIVLFFLGIGGFISIRSL